MSVNNSRVMCFCGHVWIKILFVFARSSSSTFFSRWMWIESSLSMRILWWGPTCNSWWTMTSDEHLMGALLFFIQQCKNHNARTLTCAYSYAYELVWMLFCYSYVPFCNSRTEMEGFRFWDKGFWKEHLKGKPYHIRCVLITSECVSTIIRFVICLLFSALYVVDLPTFRQNAVGDILRAQYQVNEMNVYHIWVIIQKYVIYLCTLSFQYILLKVSWFSNSLLIRARCLISIKTFPTF